MLILTSGHFGEAVGARLAASHDAVLANLHASAGRMESLLAGHDFVAVATWRAEPALCRELDDVCFAHGVRWSMVQIDGDVLTCGPLVEPGRGACHHCYQQRASAQTASLQWARALQAHYDTHPDAGPAGYPAVLVTIGAAALAEDKEAYGAAARVRTIDILTSIVRESSVIGIHRCPRCRSRGPDFDPTERSVADLVPHLERILHE